MTTPPVDGMDRTCAAPVTESLSVDRFAELFNRHFAECVRLAGLMGADDPENVAQEAFARIHLRMDRFATVAEALAYTRAIVCNLSRRNARRGSLARTLWPRIVSAAVVDDLSAELAESERVSAAVTRLPKRQREATVLRFWLGLSTSEIAAVLGVSDGSVKTHMHRAMSTLGRLLEDPTPEEQS